MECEDSTARMPAEVGVPFLRVWLHHQGLAERKKGKKKRRKYVNVSVRYSFFILILFYLGNNTLYSGVKDHRGCSNAGKIAK